MKKSIFVFSLFLLICLQVSAQQANLFPTISGTTLQDKKVSIPADTKGKYTLIGITYSQKSVETLSPWFQAVYETFIDDSDYEVNMYFVTMLAGAKELAAGVIEKKMKQGIDPELHPYILLYKGDIGEYKKVLNMPDKEIPYFFVLDKDGNIIYQTSGAYSEKKMEEIESKIE
jgi:hypothetical protein